MTMGKIVKFCSECEEGFAEKFGFCPNCGSSLEAFEMNPLQREAAKAEANKAEFVQPEKPAFISSSETERENAFAHESEIADAEDFSDDDILELNVEGEETEETINEPETEAEVFAPAATAYSSNGNSGYNNYQTFSNADVTDEDDGFHVTVIEEKNVKQRNVLLLGSTVFMLIVLFSAFIFSLFSKNLDLAAIGNEDYIASIMTFSLSKLIKRGSAGDEYTASINDVQPVEIDKDEPPKIADDESGGGGGGGREEEMETSKGRLATQSRETPIIQPDKNIVQKNFELKQPVATTIGDKKIKPTEEPYGLPNSTNVFGSNGRGKGGGQGEGDGTGQGGGRGGGAGNGDGTGFGDGRGDGTGDGTGSRKYRREQELIPSRENRLRQDLQKR